jgi:hypothetical protein
MVHPDGEADLKREMRYFEAAREAEAVEWLQRRPVTPRQT